MYLKACVVRCKCGKPANAIKGFDYNKRRKREDDKKIIALNCNHCGLKI